MFYHDGGNRRIVGLKEKNAWGITNRHYIRKGTRLMVVNFHWLPYSEICKGIE